MWSVITDPSGRRQIIKKFVRMFCQKCGVSEESRKKSCSVNQDELGQSSVPARRSGPEVGDGGRGGTLNSSSWETSSQQERNDQNSDSVIVSYHTTSLWQMQLPRVLFQVGVKAEIESSLLTLETAVDCSMSKWNYKD